MAGSCVNAACCASGSGELAEKDCTSPTSKCVSCKKPHSTNSSVCLKLQKERQACKLKESNRIAFSDAVKEVNQTTEEEFAAFEVHLYQLLSWVKPDHSVIVNILVSKASPPPSTTTLEKPPPAPVVQSSSPVTSKGSVQSDTSFGRSSSFRQTTITILRGLRLLLGNLSYD